MVWLALALLTLTMGLRAGDEALRIHYFGNSLTDQLKYDHFKRLADETGHPLEWKREMAPGVPVSFWWSRKDKWEKKLTDEHWDVVTLQPFQNFEIEYQASEEFARFLKEKQPDVQLYIYAQWQARKTGNWLTDFMRQSEVAPEGGWTGSCREKAGQAFWLENVAAEAREAGMPARVERTLKNQYELTVQALRARVPMTNSVKLIPAGHVLELLYGKMRAGLVPGYASPYEFYIDGIHLNNVGSYLVGCTFYATIFGANPVGLPVGDYQGDPRHHSDHYPISDELARVIQETVWEVVATHPLTGVTCDDKVKLASASLEPAIQGEPYQCPIHHAFGKAPYAWRVASGKLPEGLDLDPNGVLRGTVSGEPGETTLTLTVSDASGATDSRDLTVVIEPDSAPAITTVEQLPTRQLGEYFVTKLEAQGGNGAMQWEPVKREKGLPPGLKLNPDGTLSGSPGQEGHHAFELRVTDADSGEAETDKRTFKLTVTPPGPGVFRVRHVNQRPSADGVLNEPFWNLAEPIEKLVAGDRTNIKATFDIVRNGGDIFVAVKVIDPDRQLKLDDLPDGDSVEVFLDVLNNREQIYNYDDRRVVVAPADTWYRPMVVAPMTFGHNGKCASTEDGYTAEFWFSFWALGYPKVDYPAVMGLDIAINDDDDGDGRDSQVVWQGTAQNATVPQFGTIVLEPESGKP